MPGRMERQTNILSLMCTFVLINAAKSVYRTAKNTLWFSRSTTMYPESSRCIFVRRLSMTITCYIAAVKLLSFSTT